MKDSKRYKYVAMYDQEEICEMLFLPRIGEMVVVGNYSYKVANIVYPVVKENGSLKSKVPFIMLDERYENLD